MSGSTGPPGNNGNDGITGETGSILWRVLDPNTNQIQCETGIRYEILTTIYEVIDELFCSSFPIRM
jgi:hypothetical protein